MGGIKQIFRHVEALRSIGRDAYVLLMDSRVPSWFASDAPIAHLKPARREWLPRRTKEARGLEWLGGTAPEVDLRGASSAPARRRLGPQDYLVLPEFYGTSMRRCTFGAQLLVFNQNAHYTFNGAQLEGGIAEMIYAHDLAGVLAVSRHTFDYLSYAFGSARIHLTPNGVDTSVFYPGGDKRRQIAYMPRKLPHHLLQVVQLLGARGALDGWALRPIEAMSEADVAQALRESAFFISSCHEEGFGLPPLEAAACACTVVGYTGYGAGEFMLPEHCYPIAQGDVLSFAQTLEQLLREYEVDPARLRQQAERFSAFVRERYSKDVERASIIEAWRSIAPHLAAAA